MKEHNVTFIPTVSAVDVITQYRGWKKGVNPEPANVTNKKQSFKDAISQVLQLAWVAMWVCIHMAKMYSKWS
jgi:hypothetical protein